MDGFEIPEVELSLASVKTAARDKAGLSDFGERDFEEPLSVLLQSLNDEAKLNAMGRYGQSSEVADLIAFLASDKSAYITGQNIRIDGGITRSV